MRCNRVKERLQKYIEGTLKGKDLFTIEEHLRKCPECLQELDSLKELDARLRQEVPKIWQSIEAAPDFVTRLKRIEVTKPTPTFSIGERLSALWGRRRLALATGLAVCLVIVLALTLPGMFSQDDEEETTIIAGDLTPSPMERETMEEMSTPMPTAMPAPTPTPTSEFMLSAAAPSKGTTESQNADQAPTIIGYTAEQAELAMEIVRNDPKVQEAVGHQGFRIIGVYSVEGFGFACNGITVVMEKEEADPQEAFLCACVNLDEHKVVDIMFSPTRPPDIIPEPPLFPTPSPSLGPEPRR